jgi:hypothetical protein
LGAVMRLLVDLHVRIGNSVHVRYRTLSNTRGRRRNSYANTPLPYEMNVASARDGTTTVPHGPSLKIEHKQLSNVRLFGFRFAHMLYLVVDESYSSLYLTHSLFGLASMCFQQRSLLSNRVTLLVCKMREALYI